MILFGREQVFVHFGEQTGVVRDSGFGFWSESSDGRWGCGRRSAGELTDCESDSRDHENEGGGKGQHEQPV